jgi:hypothetical protein
MTDFETNLKQVLDDVIQKQAECARLMADILLKENTRLNSVPIQKIAQLIESLPTGCPQKIMDELKELINDEEIGS